MSALIYIAIALICVMFLAMCLSGLASHNPK
jgi:hypothetical protein